MTDLRVAELAARAGVRASAVRFYERGGTSGGGNCRDAYALLRKHLTARAARLDDQMAEVASSREQTQAAFGRLTARQSDPGGCHDGCACAGAFAPATAPTPAPSDENSRPAGCTLDDDQLACRVGEWRALAEAALSAGRDRGILRLSLDPTMIPAASALIAAEAVCCPAARFTLEVTAGQAFLTAEFPL